MKPVIKRRPNNRLAKLIHVPGGKTVEAIEADVEVRLDALKDTCFASLQGKIQEIVRLAGAAPRPPAREDLDQLYTLSKEVLGLAGVAHLEDAGRAALSFCRLLDGWRGGKAWSAAPFDVHLAALQLLAQMDSDLDETARDHMVQGLNTVVQRALV
jgi:hypothetical protein